MQEQATPIYGARNEKNITLGNGINQKEAGTFRHDGRFSTRVWQTFSVREWRVNILGFEGHTIPAIATQLYHYNMKLSRDKNINGYSNFSYRH